MNLVRELFLWRWFPLAVFVLALTLRVGLTQVFEGIGSPPKEAAGGLDVVDYEGFAWRVAAGEGYTLPNGTPTARRSPGTSLSILPIYYFFGHSFVAAHLWFCTLSALTCVALCWLGSVAGKPVLGGIAGLALAFYPGHFYYSMHFFSEVPAALFLVLTVGACYLALSRRAILWPIVAGVALAFAVLTRPNLILVFPAAFILVVWRKSMRQFMDFRSLAILAVSFGLVLSPWLARNYQVMGKATISTLVGGYTFWGANNDLVLNNEDQRGGWIFTTEMIDREHPLSGSEIERESSAWHYGAQFVRSHLPNMPTLIAWRIVRLMAPFEPTANRVIYWTFAASWFALLPLAAFGLWRLAALDRLLCALVCSPLLATLMTVVPFYGSIRFRDLVSPLLIFLGAVTVEYFFNRCSAVSNRDVICREIR
jgi:4-amino-4-deoxy-L-arabinose transferase-like glycosyltransferase